MVNAQPVEGTLSGLPYLAIGSGPPLLALSGLTPEHVNPTGWTRWFELRQLEPLTEAYTVYVVNRRPGLAAGSSMSDLAGHVATAITQEFGEPVAVQGVSTGGSIALQLAVDHSELVSRLVVVAAACRLSDEGRRIQRTLAEHTAAGDPRRGWATFGSSMSTNRALSWLSTGFLWAFAGQMSAADPSDMLATLAAEDEFDVCADLHRIAAPTLVVGGEQDPLYSPELFQRTARGVPNGRLFLCRGKGHVGSVNDKTAQAEIGLFLRN
jgi:pimeloyl-ACP methyl ester carboxylesterase